MFLKPLLCGVRDAGVNYALLSASHLHVPEFQPQLVLACHWMAISYCRGEAFA